MLRDGSFFLRKDKFQFLLDVEADNLMQLFDRVFRLVGGGKAGGGGL